MHARRTVLTGGALGFALLLAACNPAEEPPLGSSGGGEPDSGTTTMPPGQGGPDSGTTPPAHTPDAGGPVCQDVGESCSVDDDCCFHDPQPSPMVYYFCGDDHTCKRIVIPY